MRRKHGTLKIFFFLISIFSYLLIWGACSNQTKNKSNASKYWTGLPAEGTSVKLLMGVDGADWRFLVPLMKSGKLPAVQKLFQRGAAGNLLSITMASPLEWTIIATGQTPEKNGITGFVVHDPKKGKKTVVSGNLRKVKAIWNILTEASRKIAVIGWWATWPAEKVNGAMITDLFPYRATVKNVCYPKELKSELSRTSSLNKASLNKILEKDFLLGKEGEPLPSQTLSTTSNGITTPNFGLFRRDFKYDLEKAEYCKALYEKEKFDQIALFLNSTDIASHLFYRLTSFVRENGGWPANTRLLSLYGNIIEMAYRYAEKPLIKIMEDLPDLSHVCIVSDHGFQSVSYMKKPKWNIVLHDLGLLQYREDASKKAFKNIDWKKTILYYDPRTITEKLVMHINKDRKATDEVPDLHDITSLVNYVLRKLDKVKTTDGKTFFKLLKADEKTGKLYFQTSNLDDISKQKLLLKEQPYPINRFYSPPHLSGRHRREGIILLWGAGVCEGYRIQHTNTYDVTPTMLWLNELAPSKKMDGNILRQCFTPSALSMRNLGKIDDYGPMPKKNEIKQISEAVDDTIKTKLRALGYID